MEFNPSQREQEIADFWQKNNVYAFDPNSEKPIFSIDTPPPTVSGEIHIGHIFSYTQAEVVARFKRMQGFNVFYPFGFDDNGLPTEQLVEKLTGLNPREAAPEEFERQCHLIIDEYRAKFKSLWQRVGVSTDWNLEYHTISPVAQRISQRSFLDLMKKGEIERSDAPVLWCTHCQTSVAQADVEDKELPSAFSGIRFKTEDGNDLLIETTRPELLPACVAVMVHPKDERYKDLIGSSVITPLGDTVTIYADEKVDPEKGSGAVMCCTYGDETDMHWSRKYNFPEKKVLKPDGRIVTEQLGDFENVQMARDGITAWLSEGKFLLSNKPITHAVGTHERCGTPVEIISAPQWFIKILPHKAKLLELADQIEWNPPHMKKRYIDWVENLKWDWCISRQRYFGVPIPLWRSKITGEWIMPDEGDLPIDPKKSAPSRLPEGHTPADLIPETDVLDTWATSSITPEINGKWGEVDSIFNQVHPMSVRPHAHDIIRTWSFYSIVKSYLHHGSIPWKSLMISGHVKAKPGEKISKSKSNSRATPTELMDRFSADAVRYWACGSSLGRDTYFDEKEIEKGRKLMIKLTNATRLVKQLLADYKSDDDMPVSELHKADQWILSRLQKVTQKVYEHIERYEVGHARNALEQFFWSDYCDNYLEMAKSRIYAAQSNPEDALGKRPAQETISRVHGAVLKLFAPYIPFTAEALYQDNFRQNDKPASIHQALQETDFISLDEETSQKLESDVDTFQAILSMLRKEKIEQRFVKGRRALMLTIKTTRDQIAQIMDLSDELRGMIKTDALTFEESDHFECQFTDESTTDPNEK